MAPKRYVPTNYQPKPARLYPLIGPTERPTRKARRLLPTLLREQAGVCPICLSTPVTGSFVIDHIHGTQQIRGALCSPCNIGLGMLGDDPFRLHRAASYLITHLPRYGS